MHDCFIEAAGDIAMEMVTKATKGRLAMDCFVDFRL